MKLYDSIIETFKLENIHEEIKEKLKEILDEVPISEEKLLIMEVALKVDKYSLVLYADKIPTDFKNAILADADVQDYLRERVEVWEEFGYRYTKRIQSIDAER